MHLATLDSKVWLLDVAKTVFMGDLVKVKSCLRTHEFGISFKNALVRSRVVVELRPLDLVTTHRCSSKKVLQLLVLLD